tara:strand:- start:2734 stop:3003 length:270 start_codon:yes stop_codon:yes gene_type:complete
MQIKGTADVNVEVRSKDLVLALKGPVYKKLNLPCREDSGDVFVKDSKWVEEVRAHTSHAFEFVKAIGPAREEDVEVFEAYHTLVEFLKD